MEPSSILATSPICRDQTFNVSDTRFFQDPISQPVHVGPLEDFSISSSSYLVSPTPQLANARADEKELANARRFLGGERFRDTYEKLRRLFDPCQQLSKTDVLLKVLSYLEKHEAMLLQQEHESSSQSEPASLLPPATAIFSDDRSLAWGSDAGGSAPISSSSSSSYALRPRQSVKVEDEGQNLAHLRTQSENRSRLETERLRDTYEKLRRFTSDDPHRKMTKTDILLNVLSFLKGHSFPLSSDASGSAGISSSSPGFSSVSRLPRPAKAQDDKEQKLAHRRRQSANSSRRERAKFRDTLEKLRRCTTFNPHQKMTKMDILLNAVSYVQGLEELLLLQGYTPSFAQPAISEGSPFMWSSDAGDSSAWGGPHPEAVQDGTNGPAFAQPTFSDGCSY